MGVAELGLAALIKGIVLAAGALQGAQELGAKTPAPSDVLGKGKAQQGPARTAELEKSAERKVQRQVATQQEQATQQILAESKGDPAAAQQQAQARGLDIRRRAEREYAQTQERVALERAAAGEKPRPLIRQDANAPGQPRDPLDPSTGSRARLRRIIGGAGDLGARVGTGALVSALTDREPERARVPALPSLDTGALGRRTRAPVRRSRTILSSPLGVSGQPNLARRTLLGQ